MLAFFSPFVPRARSVTPSKGKAILFYSLRPDGAVDPFSLHGSCPLMGEGSNKWVVNQRAWTMPYRGFS